MKSLVRLCLTAVGALCVDTDPAAAQFIVPIGEDVPTEYEAEYVEKFGEGTPEPSTEPEIQKTVPVEGIGELFKSDDRWGVKVGDKVKWLDNSSKVDLQTIATAISVELEGTKAELAERIADWADNAPVPL